MFIPSDTGQTTNFRLNEKKQRKFQHGFLLVTEQDEIIYANTQARHFLGILADESLPHNQQFLALAKTGYCCYPDSAWQGWPKRPSPDPRYLIYTPLAEQDIVQLRVDILEQIVVNGSKVWVVSLALVEAQSVNIPMPINC